MYHISTLPYQPDYVYIFYSTPFYVIACNKINRLIHKILRINRHFVHQLKLDIINLFDKVSTCTRTMQERDHILLVSRRISSLFILYIACLKTFVTCQLSQFLVNTLVLSCLPSHRFIVLYSVGNVSILLFQIHSPLVVRTLDEPPLLCSKVQKQTFKKPVNRADAIHHGSSNYLDDP